MTIGSEILYALFPELGYAAACGRATAKNNSKSHHMTPGRQTKQSDQLSLYPLFALTHANVDYCFTDLIPSTFIA